MMIYYPTPQNLALVGNVILKKWTCGKHINSLYISLKLLMYNVDVLCKLLMLKLTS